MKRKNDPGYLLPEVIEPEENCCICIPIPNDFNHKMAFLGQLDELGYWWNWERDPDKKGREAAAVWRKIVECIREELDMSGCGCGGNNRGEPTNQRYTEDGHLQVSYDNGVTWENGDGLDPRFSSPVFAPYPDGDPDGNRCKGANSIVAFIQAEKANSSSVLGAAGGLAALAASIATAVAATGVGIVAGVVIAIMGFVLNGISNAGQAAFDAAFNTLFWDELLCILYCHIGEDGTITEAQWQQIITEVGQTGTYPANEWTAYMIKTLGLVGINNASLSGNIGTASCDGCDCGDGCSTEARILLGTMVSRTETEIVIDAELTTFNSITAYWAKYGSDTGDYCCLVCEATWEPDITSAGWTNCEGAVGGGSVNGQNMRSFEAYNTVAPFTLTIKFGGDPECP